MQRLEKIWNWFTEIQWVIVLLFFSLALFLYGITGRSLWMDETAVLVYLQYTPLDYLIHYFNVPDNHPPLYYLLVNILYTLFPFGLLLIRLTSIIFALGLVALVCKFSYLLSGKKNESVATTFVFVLSPFLVLMAQMARYHTMAAFFSLLTLYWLAALAHRRLPISKAWWMIGLAGLATAWTDYPHFVYIAIIVNGYVLMRMLARKPLLSVKHWVAMNSLWLIGCLPLVWLIYHRIAVQGDGGFEKMSLLGTSFFRYIARIMMHGYAFLFGENILPGQLWVIIPGAIVLIFMLIRSISLTWRGDSTTKLLSYFFYSAVILNVLLLSFGNPRYNFIVYPKYGLVALPLFFMLLVYAIRSLSSVWWRTVLFCLVLVIQFVGLYHFYLGEQYLNPSYFNTFQEFEFVQAHKLCGDTVIINGDLNIGEFRFYEDTYFACLTFVSIYDQQAFDTHKSETGRYWFFTTAHDAPEGSVATDDQIPAGFAKIDGIKTTPLDERFKQMKEKVLQRPSYTYKNAVYLLERL